MEFFGTIVLLMDYACAFFSIEDGITAYIKCVSLFVFSIFILIISVLQKDSFCTSKGFVLQGERSPFGGRKESF